MLDVYNAYGFSLTDPETWIVESDTQVLLTDGDQNKLFLDAWAQKDEAKALGAKWIGEPIYAWWIPKDQYEGAITQWQPKLISRSHPTIGDALRYAQNIHTASFLGTNSEAVGRLQVANRAAQSYQRESFWPPSGKASRT